MTIGRKILSIMLSAMGALAVTSCVYDDVLESVVSDNEPEYIPGKLTVEMRIRSIGDNASRAAGEEYFVDEELVDGEHIEHAIGKDANFAIFFTEDKKFYTITPLTFTEFETPDNEVIETTYKTTLDPKDYEDNLPVYCLVLLNAKKYYKEFSSFTSANTASEVLNKIWEVTKNENPSQMGRDEDGLFLMTNSTYYDKEGVLQQLVPLTEKNIFDPKDPLSIAMHEVVTVYVERVCAKFTFNMAGYESDESGDYIYKPTTQQLIMFEDIDYAGNPTFSAVNWKLNVTGWGVNAYETKTNIFKYLDGSNYFPEWAGWKLPGAYRTYWSQDPHYTRSDKYAHQYRMSVDKSMSYYEKMENDNENVLRNFSFNDLDLDNLDLEKTIYTPENTYNFTDLYPVYDLRVDLLAGTHLVVGARLLIGTDKDGYKTGDWYRDRQGIYYKNELDAYRALMHNFVQLLQSQNTMKFIWYNWTNPDDPKNGRVYYARPANTTTNKYKLYWNGNEINESTVVTLFKNKSDYLKKATIEHGDGKRLPWPSDNENTLRINGTNTELSICTMDADGVFHHDHYATIDDVKSLLFEWIGGIDHFNQGRMYYAAPITLTQVNNIKICGVVRNAWYVFRLHDITRMGTPVDVLDQPIIPDDVNHYDQLNVSISIFDWHYIDTKYPSFN